MRLGRAIASSLVAFATALSSVQSSAADDRTVAIAPFAGDSDATDDAVAQRLVDAGQRPTLLKATDAAPVVECGARPTDACLAAASARLHAAGIAFDVLVTGHVQRGVREGVHVVVFDARAGVRLASVSTTYEDGDDVTPIVVPDRVVAAIAGGDVPPTEPHDLAALDEPAKSSAQLARESERIALAERRAEARVRDELAQTLQVPVDLKKDFRSVCRTGPRKGRLRDDPSPRCQLGPFFGYWQPRSWVVLGLASAALVTSGVFYGLAASTRDEHEAAIAEGDDARIADTKSQLTQRALFGDIAIATAALLVGVLAITVVVDRHEAKGFVRETKVRRLLAKMPFSIAVGRGSAGASVRLRF